MMPPVVLFPSAQVPCVASVLILHYNVRSDPKQKKEKVFELTSIRTFLGQNDP